MVGNENDAARALTGDLEFLGEGCTRRVYVDNDRAVVYKVEHFDTEVDHTSNYDEVETAARLMGTLPSGYALPNMTLYDNGVLAMDYIDGELLGECFCVQGEEHLYCLPEHMASFLSTVSEDCLTWGNTCMRDGILYLIDLGH